ncbi:unnamed protein product [Clonostachys rosea]|uniref:FHA domain-containing protein n=1 Tax=Bionectria ochroleuca TaxID=29856 RepID=A0ABY6UTB8_BIOOC|nr:unnamed protein product [Clonostachys rosea]
MSDGLPILKLLFSGEILETSFDVPSQLKVLRCVARGYGGHLLVDGSSTYNGVRLDKWQAHRHKNHTLIIGHKRGLRIVLNDTTSLPNRSQCRSRFNESERSQLDDHFEDMSSKSRWDEVKGTDASIMGIAVESVKLAASFKGAAGGMYFKYAFGFHAVELGMGGAKVATIATAAGGAVALGVDVAAAVYFIPWEGLFDWLKRSFPWRWDKICALWQSFKNWVKRLFSSSHARDTGQ